MKIAVIGFGVVGSGVVELFYKNQKQIEKKCNQSLDIGYILNRRGISDSSFVEKAAKSFDEIVNDADVGVVVEVIGGINPAFEYTLRSLKAGKHVITANKELVACHGAALLQVAKEHNVNYLFEASVGGGIPVIHPLYQCLGAGEITDITGILNGTTNFIMTRMIADKMGFAEALKLAQENGYAEADPTADVMGIDACRKISILGSIAFGKHIYPDEVHTEGIVDIDARDVQFADAAGYVIKLIGRALKKDGKIFAMVSPALVKKSSQLANISDVYNGVLVRGADTGDVLFYGKGAGKLPTASAVISDIIDALKEGKHIETLGWQDAGRGIVAPHDDDVTQVMVRFDAANPPQAVAELTPFLRAEGQAAVLTAPITGSALKKLREDKRVLSALRVLEY